MQKMLRLTSTGSCCFSEHVLQTSWIKDAHSRLHLCTHEWFRGTSGEKSAPDTNIMYSCTHLAEILRDIANYRQRWPLVWGTSIILQFYKYRSSTYLLNLFLTILHSLRLLKIELFLKCHFQTFRCWYIEFTNWLVLCNSLIHLLALESYCSVEFLKISM